MSDPKTETPPSPGPMPAAARTVLLRSRSECCVIRTRGGSVRIECQSASVALASRTRSVVIRTRSGHIEIGHAESARRAGPAVPAVPGARAGSPEQPGPPEER